MQHQQFRFFHFQREVRSSWSPRSFGCAVRHWKCVSVCTIFINGVRSEFMFRLFDAGLGPVFVDLILSGPSAPFLHSDALLKVTMRGARVCCICDGVKRICATMFVEGKIIL
eukprot:jgi/Botrbrau1/17878/Bobra.0717s0001.1